MPIALVTGASSGIGHGVATQLLADGWTVIGLARRAESMPHGVLAVPVDLADPTALEAALTSEPLASVEADLLVHCAGYGDFAPVELTPAAEATRQLQVNVVAAARLAQHVLPSLRRTGGRIALVSSIASPFSSPMGGWYHAGKAALEALADSLRQEVGPQGVEVVVVQPGPVRTPWHDHALSALEERTAGTVYEQLGAGTAAYHRSSLDSPMVSEVPDVAAVVVRAATAPRPRTRYLVGRGSRLGATLPRVLPDRVFDRMALAQFGGR